uniref:Uncharacterized protein n=2 Tax=Oryza TaxID=4527 RepID=A0A0E0PBG9_ORYRU
MLRAAASRCARGAIRRLSSAASPAAVAAGARRQPPLDEGDWSYHREWWGEDEGPGEGAHTVFRRHSEHGNGVVSVSAYPASRPASDEWTVTERWLQERNARIYPNSFGANQFKILGYQWRVMRFNDHTRQSVAKVMACYRSSGAVVHIVEIDPVVASASIDSMGFPSLPVKGLPPEPTKPANGNELLWGGIHDRLFLHIADAEDFVANDSNVYDLVFIDAYDGDDIFPRKLWDAEGTFLKNLEMKVHPVHGTVVVNLHSDSELSVAGVEKTSSVDSILPLGKHVSQVCRAYKQHFGLAFTAAVPWLCNITLVACRDRAIASGARLGLSRRDFVLGKLLSKSNMVEHALDLPFPCLQYIKNGFTLVD